MKAFFINDTFFQASSNDSSTSITAIGPTTYSPLNSAVANGTSHNNVNNNAYNTNAGANDSPHSTTTANATNEEAAAAAENDAATTAKNQRKSSSGCGPNARSRTDSLVKYTPQNIGEAPGATFYINKKGGIDYNQLLKVRT